MRELIPIIYFLETKFYFSHTKCEYHDLHTEILTPKVFSDVFQHGERKMKARAKYNSEKLTECG